MSSIARPSARAPSRRLLPTFALALAWLFGCGDAGTRLPVSAPHPGAAVPTTHGDLTFWSAPAETLFVHESGGDLPDDLALLFYRGRGVDRGPGGEAYVPDPLASRVLVVDADLAVRGVIGGPDEGDGGVGQPLAAAPAVSGGLFVADAEHEAGLLYYDETGAYRGSAAPPVSNPDLRSGAGGHLWAARSPYILRFEDTPLDAPLLYRFDPLEGTGVGIATIEPVGAPAWNRVANAGPVAAGPDGTGYFAFFLRNELRAYAPDGELLWRTRRGLHYETYEPVFTGEGETLRYSVRPVTQALSMGPDGRLYALTTADSVPDPTSPVSGSGGTRRLEAYDPETGALLRASLVPGDWTSFAADREGRIFRIDPDRIDRGAPPAERAPLPSVPLVSFAGDTTRFADHRGKALLVNFWASWCAPCREELPQLEDYYATLDRDRVEFLAISVDEDRSAALDFIEPFDPSFPIFYGGPGMQEHFHYVGLPFTLVVDPRGRIVEEVHGFGSAETWAHLTETLEGEMPEAAAAAEAHDHGGEHQDGGDHEGGEEREGGGEHEHEEGPDAGTAPHHDRL